MASNAIVANHTKFMRGNGATPTEVFTEVAEVYDINLGAPAAPDIDVSSLSSLAREKRGGLPDFGTANVTMNYVEGDVEQEAMEDEAGLNVKRNYKVLHPDGTHGYIIEMILKACGPSGYAVDGKLIRTASFAVSGKPQRIP